MRAAFIIGFFYGICLTGGVFILFQFNESTYLERWVESLITPAATLTGGGLAFFAILYQLHTNKREKLQGIKVLLPLAISSIYKASLNNISSCFEPDNANYHDYNPVIEFNNESIKLLRECAETADENLQKVLANIFSKYQVAMSWHIDGLNPHRACLNNTNANDYNAKYISYLWAEICFLIETCFEFARNQSSTVDINKPIGGEIYKQYKFSKIVPENYNELNSYIEKRQEKKYRVKDIIEK